MIKHFLNSLSLLMAFDAPEARVLDIGAGAGFPGLPLKIVRPQWPLILLEATGKKVAFLQHLIETLHCTSIAAVHGRAGRTGAQRRLPRHVRVWSLRVPSHLSLPFLSMLRRSAA